MAPDDLTEIINQRSDAMAWKGLKYDCLESDRANWLLWSALYALFDFSIVFQWSGDDLLSDLRSPNKKNPRYAPHTKLRIHC